MRYLKNRNVFLEASVNDIAEKITFSDFVKMIEYIQDILASYADDNELELVVGPIMKNYRSVIIKEGEDVKYQLENIPFGKLESADRVEVKINCAHRTKNGQVRDNKIDCNTLGEIKD
jgi:hypothetical protein